MAHQSIPSSSATSPGVVGFRALPDLACANVGGKVLQCTDDFFAEKENLIKPEAPVFIVGKFTDNGKWMDGWESRRKRVAGHDWAILALGTPGTVSGVVVDTSYFVGNFPESCSLEAATLADGEADPAALEKAVWTPLIPQSTLAGGTANYLPSEDIKTRVTHIRFHIYPDGGVARLRVHGTPLPNWKALSASAQGGLIDVASALHGASVVTSNDAFFGAHSNLILPGRAATMGDGWETRRKRILPGHDWIVVKLGRAARIQRVEVDTNHFKGNFPDSALVEAVYLDPSSPDVQRMQPMDFHRPHPLLAPERFVTLVEQTKLHASEQRYFEKDQLKNTDKLVTHIRMKIFPDGGISRLRMWGAIELTDAEKQ